MSQTSSFTQTKKLKSKKLITWLIGLILLGIVIYLNSGRIAISYIYLLGSKNFKEGQKVYLSQEILKFKYDVMIQPKLLRALTVQEVRDSFFLSNEQRHDALVIARNTDHKPVLQFLQYGIQIAKLKGTRSAAIGTFIDKKILPFKTESGELGYTVFYVIKPYPNIVYNDISMYQIPKGFKLADNYMYVFSSNASDKEAPYFNK